MIQGRGSVFHTFDRHIEIRIDSNQIVVLAKAARVGAKLVLSGKIDLFDKAIIKGCDFKFRRKLAIDVFGSAFLIIARALQAINEEKHAAPSMRRGMLKRERSQLAIFC